MYVNIGEDDLRPQVHNYYKKRPLDEAMKGQIALLLLEQQFQKDGMWRVMDFNAIEIAETLNIPYIEAVRDIEKLLAEIFAKGKIIMRVR